MTRLRTTALITLLAVALGGCGSSAKKAPDGESAASFSGAFLRATGVKLVPRTTGKLTILGAQEDGDYSRFGVYSIYVVGDAETRKQVLADRTDLRDYGKGVYVSAPSADERSARLATAVKAALANDPSRIPAADRLCSAVGIDPAAGNEGTCRLPDKRLTVVNAGTELVTPATKAKLTGLSVRTTLPKRNDYDEVRRARGRYLVVRFALTNTQNAPLTSLRTTLVIDGKSYSESSDAYALTDYRDPPFPLQPDEHATVTTAFDVPEAAAQAAKSTGALELPAATTTDSAYLSDRDAVGRIRLSGASALSLQGSASKSASSTTTKTSSGTTKATARKAAAEAALKQFYSALHNGNVKYVCRRLTRSAQQKFGGAAACASGRFIKASAKAKAPSSNVGLRFTTLLTNGETRALILVRRENGGFTDTARLARQGNLWRVQGTRRLSS